eukprot:TRINITY_DN3004_c0_g2_i1.p1 TRINITY_DN3004_c0_g2~~TRINITY_DN3004_c0_g2_i1.p1  ORF type:complete len:315 (+),score=84.15 TRINITY_DN3004_c0_g2_i1:110-1054(+)
MYNNGYQGGGGGGYGGQPQQHYDAYQGHLDVPSRGNSKVGNHSPAGSRNGSKTDFPMIPNSEINGGYNSRNGSKDLEPHYSSGIPLSDRSQAGSRVDDQDQGLLAGQGGVGAGAGAGGKAPWSMQKKICVGSIVAVVLIIVAIFATAGFQSILASIPTITFQMAHFAQTGLGTGSITAISGTQNLTVQNNNNFAVLVAGTQCKVTFTMTTGTVVAIGNLTIPPVTIPAKSSGVAFLNVNMAGYSATIATQISTQETTNGQSAFDVNGGAITMTGKVAVGNAVSTIPLVCSMTVANDNSVAFNCNNDATGFKLTF